MRVARVLTLAALVTAVAGCGSGSRHRYIVTPAVGKATKGGEYAVGFSLPAPMSAAQKAGAEKAGLVFVSRSSLPRKCAGARDGREGLAVLRRFGVTGVDGTVRFTVYGNSVGAGLLCALLGAHRT